MTEDSVTEPQPGLLEAQRKPVAEKPFYIVAVGASAGGLEALEKLFGAMPVDSGMAFVVIQHLSPDFKSHLPELLARKTAIDIRPVSDGLEVEPDGIYLIPPRKQMSIKDGKLQLTERNTRGVPLHSVDTFFSSLAEDWGRRSVGIVLSGTGKDGTVGIQKIKAAGGLVLCQLESTARFDGMLLSAQSSGVVDAVITPESMAETLVEYIQCADNRLVGNPVATPLLVPEKEMILQLLKNGSGIDFGSYKQTTVERRIARRMDMLGMRTLSNYRQYLQKRPQEIEILCQDMLIGVTRFFRDPDAFELLRSELLPALLRRVAHSGKLRIWVCACASGEEAISMAIVLEELMAEMALELDVKIFATDVHAGSLDKATLGVYHKEAVSGLSDARLARHFKFLDGVYVLNSNIRSLIVYARHNVLTDAPFTQLDFVCCRNLLIYFQSVSQRKAISMFHFSLKSGGMLMLGPSESVSDIDDEFDTVNLRWRVYKKRRDVSLPLHLHDRLSGTKAYNEPSWIRPTVSAGALVPAMPPHAAQLLQAFAPAGWMVDKAFNVIHSFAGIERFTATSQHAGIRSLPDCVVPSLKEPLIAALRQALHERADVHYGLVRLQLPDAIELWSLSIKYFKATASDPLTLMAMLSAAEGDTAPVSDSDGQPSEHSDNRMRLLEADLDQTRVNLQSTIEELESANEELQSTNEEMLSSNEELQSTNEELQSVNEELFSVNHEFEIKIEELRRSNDDMDNLLEVTQVGVLFMDKDYLIRRYTPEMSRLFNLSAEDIGSPLASFPHTLDYDELMSDIARAVETQEATQRSVLDHNGVSWLVRVAPYRRESGVSGAVLMLVDASAMQEAQRKIARFKYMVDQAAFGKVLVNTEGQFLYANASFCTLVGYSEEELLGRTVEALDDSYDARTYSALFKRLNERPRELFETRVRHVNGELIPIEVSANLVEVEGRNILYASIQDITERLEAQSRLALYESAMEASDSGISIADLRLPDTPLIYVNHAFTSITGYRFEEVVGRNCRFLQGKDTEPSHREQLHDAMQRKESSRVTLLNYRKDQTPFWNDLIISPVAGKKGEVHHYVGVSSDVTDRVDEGLKILEREAQVSALLESAAEGILGLNANGDCIFLNRAARQLLNFEESFEPATRSVDQIMRIRDSHDEEINMLDFLQPVLSGAESRELVSVQVYKNENRLFAGIFRAQPIIRDNSAIGAVVSFVDNTEELARQQELLDAIDAADAANRAKSEFLANMSHEIRTPLAAIMGYSDLLGLSLLDEENRKNSAAIKQNAFHLLDIVNDILDLSKIESEKIEVELAPVSINAFMSSLYAMNRVRVLEKSLTFDIQCLTPVPETIQTDLTRLRQVLINLLGNAIKFTHSGGVKVLLSMADGELRIAVQDSGVGIEPSEVDDLFQPFKQGDASLNSQYGGTGLGLSISKRLITLLGGRIDVDSQVNEGSTFTVCVPVNDLQGVRMISTLQLEEPNLLPLPDTISKRLNKHILIADDQPHVLNAIQGILEKAGAKVTTAYDGRMALAIVQQRMDDFDLLLLDIQMPLLSGLELTRMLRASGYDKPIVALTAQAMKGDEERYLDCGFSAFLPKPLDAMALIEKLAEHLEETPESSTWDILIVEDHADSRRVVSRLLQRRGHSVRTAGSGAQALAAFADGLPQLCLLDMRLGDMHGLELMQAAASRYSVDQMVVVAMTGNADKADQANYAEAGITKTLLKPVSMEKLDEAIASLTPPARP